MEELLEGNAKSYGSTSTSLVRRIESRSEFDELIKRVKEDDHEAENRGIVMDKGLFMLNNTSNEIIHLDLRDYLVKQGIAPNSWKYSAYQYLTDEMLTVQIRNGKLYIGESYNNEFYDKIMEDGTKERENFLKFYDILKKIGITLYPENAGSI